MKNQINERKNFREQNAILDIVNQIYCEPNFVAL